jgi:hypothetical protein
MGDRAMSIAAPAVQPAVPPGAAPRPRDPRLDFFRGVAMFIILLAHTPNNTWTLWIPARFGFSDATEIFVFCSGMASALAFGAVFRDRGFGLGVARVGFRVWQVYWAHIGVFLATVAMLYAIESRGWGSAEVNYLARPFVVPFFERTGDALVGLLSLAYVPGLFDILPMYLVILAMIPAVMGLHRLGGGAAVAAASVSLWALATLAGLWRTAGDGVGDGGGALARLGASLQGLNLPALPWGDATWFFNPFAWQIVFFTGFAFGMRWLPPPPVSRRLVLLCVAVLLLSLPFAWFQIHEGFYLPPEWALKVWIAETRAALEPLWWKPWQGAFRLLHFLALAYLAWVAVGPRGGRLSEGLTAPERPVRLRRRWALIGAALALPTTPYAYIDTIKALAPAVDAFVLAHFPLFGSRTGILQLVHLAGLILLVWNALPQSARAWALGPAIRAATPVIRKVGTQSLAVFMVSIPLSQAMGAVLDVVGSDVWTRAAVNLSGFAVLVGTAYLCGWIKGHPWRRPAPRKVPVARTAPSPAE